MQSDRRLKRAVVDAPAVDFEVVGPDEGSSSVSAWTDQPVRFDNRTPVENDLRRELCDRVRQLAPGRDQILLATFFGQKRSGADIENLVFYNLSESGAAFASAGQLGVRFEYEPAVPESPSGRVYRSGYRYETVDRDSPWRAWQNGDLLASWDWVDLGPFSGEKKAQQVWLALRRAPVDVHPERGHPGQPFAVRVAVRPPLGTKPRAAGLLLKGVFDGVISAFQSHEDATTLADPVARLAASLDEDASGLTRLLTEDDRAVLGPVPRLLGAFRGGIKWYPSDDLCLAGELLLDESTKHTWALRGEIRLTSPR